MLTILAAFATWHAVILQAPRGLVAFETVPHPGSELWIPTGSLQRNDQQDGQPRQLYCLSDQTLGPVD